MGKLKWVLMGLVFTFLGGVAACVGLAAWAYSFLQTPAGGQMVLKKVQGILAEKMNTRLTYRQGLIRPFSSFHFDQLRVSQETRGSSLDVQVDSLDIQFSISILAWTLTIKSIRAENPRVSLHSESWIEGSASSAKPAIASSAEDGAIISFLTSRWMPKLVVEQFALEKLSLQFEKRTSASQLRLELKDVSSISNFQWLTQDLSLVGGFDLNGSSSVLYIQQSGSQKTKLMAFPSFSGKWMTTARYEAGRWKCEVQQPFFQVLLKSFKINQVEPQSALQLEGSGLNLQSQAKAWANLQNAFLTLQTGAILDSWMKVLNKLEFNGTLSSGPILMGRQVKGKKAEKKKVLIQFDPIQLESQLTQERGTPQFQFKIAAPQVKSPFLGKPLSFRTQGTCLFRRAAVFEIQGAAEIGQGETQRLAEIEHSLEYNQGRSDLKVEFHVPTLDFPEMRNFLKKGGVNIGQVLPVLGALGKVNGKLEASFDGKSRLLLKNFETEFSPQAKGNSSSSAKLHLDAEVTGNFQTKNLQTQGMLKVEVPKSFPHLRNQVLYGKVQVPWTLAIYRGQRLNLEGKLEVYNARWKWVPSHGVDIQGISGSIPISEQLIWDGSSIQFANLIEQNPFERVDFERLQPMLNETEQVTFTGVDVQGKHYGPFQGFFSIRQNMIFVHKFDLKIASGRTSGEMYLDVFPSSLQLGVLARITQLNLGEILPKQYLVQGFQMDQVLSGRSGLVFNLNKGSVDGRVDVTEIGRTQLLTLLNVLDPNYENEKMNGARSALAVAYPSFIQLSFKKGYLDMDIQLKGFPLPDITLRGIPIYSWISGYTSGAKEEIFGKSQKGLFK